MSKDAVLELKVRRIASKGNDKEMFEIYSKILEDVLEQGRDPEAAISSFMSEYKGNQRIFTLLDDLYEDLFRENE